MWNLIGAKRSLAQLLHSATPSQNNQRSSSPDETKTSGLWHRSYADCVHAEIYSKLIHVSVNAGDDAAPSILAEIRKVKLDGNAFECR